MNIDERGSFDSRQYESIMKTLLRDPYTAEKEFDPLFQPSLDDSQSEILDRYMRIKDEIEVSLSRNASVATIRNDQKLLKETRSDLTEKTLFNVGFKPQIS